MGTEVVIFSSYDNEYQLQKSGVKNNITRPTNEFSQRYEILKHFDGSKNLNIEIYNLKTKDQFTRKVSNVFFFGNLFTITWHLEKKKML